MFESFLKKIHVFLLTYTKNIKYEQCVSQCVSFPNDYILGGMNNHTLKKKQIIAQTVKNKLGLYYSKVFFIFYDECNKNAKFTLAIYSEEKKVKKKK